MKILKTESSRFDKIKDFPYQENFVQFNELKMHYVDEGKGETILALHGEPSWSYLYRKFIPTLSNYRFIAPDLIGFGKSDKIEGWRNYSFELHFKSLENLIVKLNLNDITLVVQDWGGLLGLSLLGEFPDRFKRVVILNTFLPIGEPLPKGLQFFRKIVRVLPSFPVGSIIQRATFRNLSKEVIDAYKAPFPNRSYKGGVKAFPLLLPVKSTDGGVKRIKKARRVLFEWSKPALVLFSDKDEILSTYKSFFHELIPTCKDQEDITVMDAGHFLQEDKGEEIAIHIDQFIKGNLKKVLTKPKKT